MHESRRYLKPFLRASLSASMYIESTNAITQLKAPFPRLADIVTILSAFSVTYDVILPYTSSGFSISPLSPGIEPEAPSLSKSPISAAVYVSILPTNMVMLSMSCGISTLRAATRKAMTVANASTLAAVFFIFLFSTFLSSLFLYRLASGLIM